MVADNNYKLNTLKVKYEIKNIINSLNEMGAFTANKNSNLLADIYGKSFKDAVTQIDNNSDLSTQEKADIYFQNFLITEDYNFLIKSTGKDQPIYSSIAWVIKTIKEYINNDDLSYSHELKEILVHKKVFDQKIIEELFSNLDLSDLHQEAFCDWKIVHKVRNQNFQKQKLAADADSENLANDGALTGWFNESINIKHEEATKIGKLHGVDLYGWIAPKFKTDNQQKALEEGLASRAHGKEGVKILDKKFLELKNLSEEGDTRLYTSILHKNKAGDLLAIFDHETNHSTLQNKVNAVKKLSILDDYLTKPTELLFSGDSSFENELSLYGQDSGCLEEN